MNPDLSDPHNHVPEVSPDDRWGDVESLRAATTVLPPKRQPLEVPAGSSNRRPGGGLRIESKPQRIHSTDTENHLEVQQIDGSVVRLSPESIAPPWGARQVTFQERPPPSASSRLRRGEMQEWGLAHRHSLRWIVGTGVGVFSLIVIAMMMLPAINKSNAARPDQVPGLVIDPVEPTQDFDMFQALFVRQDEAEQVFRAYAAARMVDEVLPLVRDYKSVEPLIRSRFRAMEVPKGWHPPIENAWSIASENGGIYGILEGSLPDFSRFCAYLIEEDGFLRLDWKASTGFGTAGFAEMEAGTGDVSEIRAMIAPTGFFNGAFPEESYRSYQLISPDKEKVVWCYTRRGEPIDARIGILFEEGLILEGSTAPVKITLRLERGPAASLPNQWLIAEMLHKDWIKP